MRRTRRGGNVRSAPLIPDLPPRDLPQSAGPARQPEAYPVSTSHPRPSSAAPPRRSVARSRGHRRARPGAATALRDRHAWRTLTARQRTETALHSWPHVPRLFDVEQLSRARERHLMNMLALLGFATIGTLLLLVTFTRTPVIAALVLTALGGAAAGGFGHHGRNVRGRRTEDRRASGLHDDVCRPVLRAHDRRRSLRATRGVPGPSGA